MVRVLNICGARPNFMKVAPLMAALRTHGGFDASVVHTGQHYDRNMSALFFEDLGLPEPDVNLGVGSGSGTWQTAEIMQRFEPVLLEQRPDWVVVVGDVNGTIACALTAARAGIRVAHVEAGLRSFDRTMPEELNRVLTDAISDLLLVSEPSGVENLRDEGVAAERVHLVGNVMIDTLRANQGRAAESPVLETLGLTPRQFAVLTLHRPSNVDDPARLAALVALLGELQDTAPVVFPVHPRTRARLSEAGLLEDVEAFPRVQCCDPLGYLDFLKLIGAAAVVLTDSGGIQEETTILGVHCLTLRENTERPITLTAGTNQLVGTAAARVLAAFRACVAAPVAAPPAIELWDGQAAPRIAALLAR